MRMKINKGNEPLVSVLVFGKKSQELHESEKLVLKNQTYKNIEALVVPNGRNMLENICDTLNKAKGEYLIFWDINNLLSKDYIRSMVVAANDNEADLVLSDICKLENGTYKYYNLNPIRNSNLLLEDKEIKDFFAKYHFTYWGVTDLWNKMISNSMISIVLENLRIFSTYKNHQDDNEIIYQFVFSLAIWISAKRLVNEPNVYAYCQRKPTATNMPIKSIKQYKNLYEMIKIACGESLVVNSDLRAYMGKFIVSKYSLDLKKTSIYNELLFFSNKPNALQACDLYFYSLESKIPSIFHAEERLKLTIANEHYSIVSFDMFDTLVYRPLYRPTDVFCLLNKKFNDKAGTSSLVDFAYMRQSSEKIARDKAREQGTDEITLKEIYFTLQKTYGVTKELCQYMEEQEKNIEIELCTTKKSMKKIYNMAQYYQKKILITTDMYLPRSTIEEILRKNDYCDYQLWLSSELRLTKESGKIYDKILGTFCLNKGEADRMIHIGDNYYSDFKIPQQKGISSFHVNGAISIFKGGNTIVNGGESFKNIFNKNTYWAKNDWQIEHYLGLRIFCGLVANKCFDYSYTSFNSESDFNGDPYYIGYYCLGGFLLGVTRWILEETKNMNVSTVHFVARDGWLLKKFYDHYTKGMVGVPKSNYLYISRKSLFTIDMKNIDDLLSILNNKISANNSTPRKILELLKPIIKENVYEKIVYKVGLSYALDEKFEKNINYTNFITAFIKKYKKNFDFENNREKCKNYLSSIIHEGDVIFDAGYTGRAEASLSSLLGYPVNAFYIHSNSDLLDQREQRYGFRTKCFYPWRPNNTGVIREHILMEYAPSVKGYDFSDERPKVKFSNFKENVFTKWFTEQMQHAALDFCSDFKSIYNQIENSFYINNFSLALPLEYFLQFPKEFDMKIFSSLEFEDEIGAGGLVNAVEFWGQKKKDLRNSLLLPQKNAENKTTSNIELYSNENVLKKIAEGLSLPKKPIIRVKDIQTNRILLYSNELSWSGAPRSLLRICKVLLRYNYQVEVWSLYDGDLKQEFTKLHVPVKIFDYNNADYNYAYKNFDLCIVNAAVSYKFYYIIQQYIPTVWYIREATNLYDLCLGNKGLAEALQESLDMVCVSEYAKNHISKNYNSNVSVVPNCVEDKFKNEKKIFNPKEVIFTTFGTIEPRKGYDVIIQAIESLPKKYKATIKFRFAGRILNYCKDWANNLLNIAAKMPNVEYLGEITDECEIHKLYTESDVVVVPSRDESCSLVVLEGAMHAKPLIVTENTGAKYMVTSENGYIVKTASVESLQESLIAMLCKTTKEIEDMGKCSRKMYEEKASMPYYDKCIIELIQSKMRVEKPYIEKPHTDKKIIPIILSTNSHYAPYAGVAIESVLLNSDKNCFYDFYIFYTRLGVDTINKFNVITDNYRITPVDISFYLDKNLDLKTCAHYSLETYYRFFCAEILSFYDKIIYLDCDLIVLEDIKKFYDIDLNGKILGAVHNYMNKLVINYVQKLKLSPYDYFNAGVLLIDIKKFAEEKIREKAFANLSEHPEYIMLDQDALNVVCQNKICFISDQWNVQWHHFENKCDIEINKQACLDAYRNPFILHFTGKSKPWNNAKLPKAHLFWEIAQKTVWLSDIIKQMQTTVIVTKNDNQSKVKKAEEKGDFKNKSFSSLIKKFNKTVKTNGWKYAIKKSFNYLRRRVKH